MYIPQDHYLWDFWIVPYRGRYHLFYLQAPRNLGDPEDRHALATVGHAVSVDLKNWVYRGTALGPGPAGSWDDRSIWTGSVLAEEDRYFMLYTGTSRADGAAVQRIGLATSTDLHTWRKDPDNPVLEADLSLYESEKESPLGERAWRDPCLITHEGQYYALITARTRTGPVEGRGCIGLARSPDARCWEVLPPVYAPGVFTQMEIPQLLSFDRRYFLLFNADSHWHAHAGVVPQVTGTFYALSSEVLGSYGQPRLLLGDLGHSRYGAKLVVGPDQRWYTLSWLRRDAAGRFVGGLSDPVPVDVSPRGLNLLA